ncbi:hypothetical protein F4802DRAFT_500813 [Xylaria palmicola]|nr:hypothetical protein F4802DRAFT_500813 [Xylaria palmicola]
MGVIAARIALPIARPAKKHLQPRVRTKRKALSCLHSCVTQLSAYSTWPGNVTPGQIMPGTIPNQYEQVLKRIQDSKEFPNKLRLEYTYCTQKFEIRMSTPLHEGIAGEFNSQFGAWKAQLIKSNNSVIVNAAKTLRLYGNQNTDLDNSEGASDSRSPDGGIQHNCTLVCKPALLLEVEFSHLTKEELRDKAKKYIEESNGGIRTVIGVYIREMRNAEAKNERRLKKECRKREPDESEAQSYATDKRNITGGASIWVWRATIQENNQIKIGRGQETKFQDAKGNAIQSAPLRIPLRDCVCKSEIDSVRRLKAPLLEVSLETLCDNLKLDLQRYRIGGAEAIRKEVEKEKEEKRNKEEEARRRREEERPRRAMGVRMFENMWNLGRLVEGGRYVSARVRDRNL